MVFKTLPTMVKLFYYLSVLSLSSELSRHGFRYWPSEIDLKSLHSQYLADNYVLKTTKNTTLFGYETQVFDWYYDQDHLFSISIFRSEVCEPLVDVYYLFRICYNCSV